LIKSRDKKEMRGELIGLLLWLKGKGQDCGEEEEEEEEIGHRSEEAEGRTKEF
jgi:hypothetical protein